MDKFSIFMTAGTLNLKFFRFFDLAKKLSEAEPVSKIIIQGVGAEDFFEGTSVEAYNFIIKEKMDEFVRSSDLIISHCGVGSIVNSVSFKKPTVLTPRRKSFNEHFDDHQLQIFNKVRNNPLFMCCDEEVFSSEDVIDFFNAYNVKGGFESLNLINNKLQVNIRDYFLNSNVSEGK